MLLHLYRKNPCLYELDHSWDGFEWINANDADRSIFSFVRKSIDGKNNMLFVINFTPVARDDYRVGVPKNKTYKLVLNSEDPKFRGKDTDRQVSYKAQKQECDGREYSFAYPLPAYGVAVMQYTAFLPPVSRLCVFSCHCFLMAFSSSAAASAVVTS